MNSPSRFRSSERYGGYIAMDHKIFGDQLVVYADGMYQNVKTHNELAAPATGNFQTPGFVTLAIPPRVANPAGTTPFGGPTYAETGVTPGAFNPFNPFNQIISGGTRARLAEFGNRLFDNESDAYLATLGFRGDKLFNGTWGYDAGFRYSQIKNTTTGTQVSISRFNRIMNQADPIFNPASPEYIGTTVAFNPFGDFRVPIPSNAASVEFARVHPIDIDTSKLATIDATIYTTDLFDLPAGGIGFAFGGQFRRESLNEDPDQLNINGDIAGNSAIATAVGGRKSYAIFVETSIPDLQREKCDHRISRPRYQRRRTLRGVPQQRYERSGAEVGSSLAADRRLAHAEIYLGTWVPRTVAGGIVFRSHLRHPAVARSS